MRSWFPGLVVPLLAVLAICCACKATKASCDVCGRDDCTALAFKVEYADGGEQRTCCPRCASHAVVEARGRAVARLRARDFATGEEIDARAALFVDGSDFEHCKAPKEQPAAPACCRVLEYDRCLPSLIAFKTRGDAERFSGEHGGVIRTFDEIRFGRKALSPDASAPGGTGRRPDAPRRESD
jgi:hypothetical protein